MPRLNELTDAYYQEATPVTMPVENPFPELKKVYITGEEPKVEQPSAFSSKINKIINTLFRDDEKRYQLWPEKVIREGLTGAGDVLAGKVPTMAIDPVTGDVHTSPEMIEKAQAISALAGTGGLAGGAEGTALNATPSLRPALKHKERLYKGKPGQEHQDIIPDTLYNDFQKKAMSGQDLTEYNFGFINDKGHFLSREDALKYGIDNGIIDPHSGKYGALTTTLLADSSKPGTAIEAMAKANPFFSALEHNVANISQGKMNGEAWLGTLSNKPGIKPEELDWTGLRSFLEENKGKPVTKAQIEQHLAENKMELREVVNKNVSPVIQDMIGTMGPTLDNLKSVADVADARKYNANFRETFKDLNDEKVLKLAQKAQEEKNFKPTKYHSYQLPGGENYREVLMTLPQGKEVWDQNLMYYMRKYPQVTKEIKTLEDVALAEKHNPAFRETMKGLSPEEVLATARASEKPVIEPYKSSHWDEPNILAHMRMNDRTIDGKKSLHLEEIQSDWHQQGRDKGYKNNLSEAETKELKDLRTKIDNGTANGDDAVRAAQLENQKQAYGGVPNAPFKKTWHELALKRAIREAAEKGYDRLSWTPGEAQAARYDLSKSVDKIAIPMVNENGTRSVRIDAKGDTPFKLMVNKEGIVDGSHSASQFSGKPLSEVVGKEMADKIMKLDKPNEFSGDGLKIGGEGMKGFYDQIIPKALEKLGKEHGIKVQYNAGKVGRSLEEELKNRGMSMKSFNELSLSQRNKILEKVDAGKPVHYIDIPQSLRNTATGKGFPLFAKGGYLLQPVDYEPEFKK